MIARLLYSGLLETGIVEKDVMAVRDGVVNVYVLRTGDGPICFDAGWRRGAMSRGFARLDLRPDEVRAVFLTHLHRDHAHCAPWFARAEVFVGAREPSAAFAKRLAPGQSLHKVDGGQTMRIGGLTVRVVDTPGHTLGSVSYVVDGRLLFPGDTLRLRRGKAVPFPRWLNRDGTALDRSLRELAGMQGIECLLTAHSGITRDVDGAFLRWHAAPVAGAVMGSDAR